MKKTTDPQYTVIDSLQGDELFFGSAANGNNHNFTPKAIAKYISNSRKRQVTEITTPELEPGAIANVTAPLGRSFVILSLGSNAPAWIRVYSSPAYRSQDAGRKINVSPTPGENGLIAESITTSENLVIDQAPVPYGASMESPTKSDIAIAIANSGTIRAPIRLTITYLKIED